LQQGVVQSSPKELKTSTPSLKQYRAIATPYDKRATNFLGAIYLAAAVIWLN
jgi:transposase